MGCFIIFCEQNDVNLFNAIDCYF